ncbi:MAG: lipopolysaccharide assembly protein LapB [Gammaproteobacteria bacterium HGW-Gammaproteobacteria-8]|nr:MAG: lipopolysaccharide assembly protein LapB [Gammaproteobacteria bacterium HGW-Gammaproteobacteria-8]
MTEVWLALLLAAPLAGWLGWILGIHYHRRAARRSRQRISSNYFRGLNYLLNEEPDKAIEVFLKLAEVNRETVETHLALGNLFRRRGEVDKAIHFHRHIISRPDLSEQQRLQALIELGEDYMRAGLLDRAEKLFRELSEQGLTDEVPIRHLLTIYQQEKDWLRAIEQARRLANPAESTALIAQFHCELAIAAAAESDESQCRQHLDLAREADPSLVRVALIEGDLAFAQGDAETALRAYRKACEADPEISVLVLDRMVKCGASGAQQQDFMNWLESLSRRARVLAPMLALSRLEAESDPDRAIQRIADALDRRPSVRGLEQLLDLTRSDADRAISIDPALLRRLLQRLNSGQPRFRCRDCGFSGRDWHWQCPSCRHWASTRPVEGVLGE